MRKNKNFLLLLFTFFVYSLATVLGKIASFNKFLSFEFIILLISQLVALFIYAILWQLALKDNKLSTAYMMKGSTIVFGLIFGVLIFKEQVSLANILGCLIIFLGIKMVVKYE